MNFHHIDHAAISRAAVEMQRGLQRVRAEAVAMGGEVLCPIHDEITIVMPDDARARGFITRLANLMRPRPARPSIEALDPTGRDPVASFLVKHYGVPT